MLVFLEHLTLLVINRNNLTQSELAEKIGLSTNFIGMVERGERNTSVDKIFKLAKAFNISLAQFFETL